MSAQQDAELSPGIFPSALRGDEVISALHLRCWKTGTPHRGGREAPRSPGVFRSSQETKDVKYKGCGPPSFGDP